MAVKKLSSSGAPVTSGLRLSRDPAGPEPESAKPERSLAYGKSRLDANLPQMRLDHAPELPCLQCERGARGRSTRR